MQAIINYGETLLKHDNNVELFILPVNFMAFFHINSKTYYVILAAYFTINIKYFQI